MAVAGVVLTSKFWYSIIRLQDTHSFDIAFLGHQHQCAINKSYPIILYYSSFPQMICLLSSCRVPIASSEQPVDLSLKASDWHISTAPT